VTALRHFSLKGGGIVMSEEKIKVTEGEKGGSLSEDIKKQLFEVSEISYSILATAGALEILMNNEFMGELLSQDAKLSANRKTGSSVMTNRESYNNKKAQRVGR
jgi:hypothetical protein